MNDADTVQGVLEGLRNAAVKSQTDVGKKVVENITVALAALARLVDELAEAREAFSIGHRTLLRMQDRAEAAEARVAQLQAALEEHEEPSLSPEAISGLRKTALEMLVEESFRAAALADLPEVPDE